MRKWVEGGREGGRVGTDLNQGPQGPQHRDLSNTQSIQSNLSATICKVGCYKISDTCQEQWHFVKIFSENALFKATSRIMYMGMVNRKMPIIISFLCRSSLQPLKKKIHGNKSVNVLLTVFMITSGWAG